MPSEIGKLPKYIQSSFRAKTFSLLTLQFAVVFVEMMVVESFIPEGKKSLRSAVWQYLFLSLGGAVLLSICLLYGYRNSYPKNYILLVAVTISVGAFWGVTSIIDDRRLHNQLIAIMGITMFVATPVSMVFTKKMLNPWHAVIGSLLVGWLTGSATVMWFEHGFDHSRSPEVSLMWSMAAMWVALLLLVTVLFDVGHLLVRCDPDDFLRVIIATNSTLLVVVSVPFLLVVACSLKACTRQQDFEAVQTPPAPAMSEPAAPPDVEAPPEAAQMPPPPTVETQARPHTRFEISL